MNNRPIASYLTLLFSVAALPLLADPIQISGVKGGVVVVLDDAPLTCGIKIDNKYLVQGLFKDQQKLKSARDNLQSKGRYGQVAVRSWDGATLPYLNNMVNLIIADDPSSVATKEILRVLAPYGVLLSKKKVNINGSTSVDGWYKIVKPWPDNIDEWTHWLHGPDNNAVSGDAYDEAPSCLQWVQGPLWWKSHQLAPPFSTMVSARGRIFYIADETLPAFDDMPDRWFLSARDAFNGTLLWKKPIKEWGEKYYMPGGKVGNGTNAGHPRTRSPQQVLRRLVAVGDHVFVTLGLYAPITMLDAATGQLIRTFEGTENAFEMLVEDGRLYAAVNKGLKKDAPDPEITMMALDIKSGKTIWKVDGQRGWRQTSFTLPQYVDVYLTLGNEGLFYISDKAIVALNRDTGEKKWAMNPLGEGGAPKKKKKNRKSNSDGGIGGVITYYKSTLLYTVGGGANTLYMGFDAETGKKLWSQLAGSYAYKSPNDLMVHNGVTWVPSKGLKSDYKELGFDVRTGKSKGTVDASVLTGGVHHNCYRNKATKNFLLFGKTKGIEYLNLYDSSKSKKVNWAKGQCRYGVMPANGMVYAPAHFCTCSYKSKLNGFVALSVEESSKPPAPSTVAQLTKGPAYGKIADAPAAKTDWPTYRQDIRRRSFQPALTSDKLNVKWTAKVGKDLTPPIIAAGKIFVASKADHRVRCLDGGTGKIRWTFTADGMVDTPPTYHKGRLVFGSRDGHVYCLDATSGALAWRFRAAPLDRQRGAFGQIESVWPAFGATLVHGGHVYCSAGRNSNTNHGIYFYKIELDTGKPVKSFRHADETSRDKDGGHAINADIMISDGRTLRVHGMPIDMATFEKGGESSKSNTWIGSMNGFLDDTYFNGAMWSYGKAKANMFAVDDETGYGVTSHTGFHWKSASHTNFHPAKKQNRIIFADSRGRPRKGGVVIPIWTKAMLAGAGNLYLAGVEDKIDPQDPWAHYLDKKGGLLTIHAKTDGKLKHTVKLKSPPVWDGMAAAGNRVFLSCKDETIICFE